LHQHPEDVARRHHADPGNERIKREELDATAQGIGTADVEDRPQCGAPVTLRKGDAIQGVVTDDHRDAEAEDPTPGQVDQDGQHEHGGAQRPNDLSLEVPATEMKPPPPSNQGLLEETLAGSSGKAYIGFPKALKKSMTASSPIPSGKPVGPGIPAPPGPGVGGVGDGGATGEVFVSYNSKDHVLVLELAEGLSKRGVKPFLDRWDLAPGLRWRPELERVLASCGAVVVMLGPHGIGEVQQREVDVALRRQDKNPKFPVVTVMLPGGEPPGGFLEQLTWVDIRHQSVPDAVGDLVGVLRKEWGGEVQRAKAKTNRRRYLVNLLLLLGTLIVLGAWYLRHAQTSLGSVAVGGSVGLPTLLWLGFLYFRWGAEEEIKNLPRRLFGSASSTWGLLVALVASAGLFASTSSIHVEAASASSERSSYSVELRSEGGEMLWKSEPLTVDRRVVSRLFFFRFGQPGQLGLDPTGDRGPIRLRLGPALSLKIRVPDQFALKTVDVLRVLPGTRLVEVLGKPLGEVTQMYHLSVVTDGSVVRISDLRRQAVYLAGTEEDISMGLGRERQDDRQSRFGEWARTQLGLPEQPSRGVASMWLDSRRFTGWTPPAGLDGIRFELNTDGGQAAELLSMTVLDPTNGLRTVLVDRIPRKEGNP